MKYKEDKTQEEQILTFLEARGERGVFVYELQAPKPHGLGIAQYNARIFGLRKKGHNIVNETPGHFILRESALPTYLKPANRTTEPKKIPQQYQYSMPQPQENLVRVDKVINGRPFTFWERPEDLQPVQQELAL
jgi:hypothetical protein